MPNWCSNTMHVSGSESEVRKFVLKFRGKPAHWSIEEWELDGKSENEIEKLKIEDQAEYDSYKPKFCFNALYPVPDDVLEAGYNKSGYDWCSSNWGTKWDIYSESSFYESYEEPETNEEEPEGKLSGDFDTAWGPPIDWLTKVAADFPLLSFELIYSETGVGFCGVIEYQDGVVLHEESYDHDQPEYRTFMITMCGYDPSDFDEEDEDYDE